MVGSADDGTTGGVTDGAAAALTLSAKLPGVTSGVAAAAICCCCAAILAAKSGWVLGVTSGEAAVAAAILAAKSGLPAEAAFVATLILSAKPPKLPTGAGADSVLGLISF